MKVSTENDNKFWYEKITIVVDNMLLILDILTRLLVGGLMSYSRYLCLFVYSGVQYILCCVLVFCPSYCTVCCQFLWIVHFGLMMMMSALFYDNMLSWIFIVLLR
jgi:hypothetical protein